MGREEHAAALSALLATCRLVTVTGTGGVGKTRLALEVVRRAHDRWPDGVWMVELARVGDGLLVDRTVCERVAGSPGDAADPVDELVEFLRRRHALVLLDTCEHVLESCAVLAKRLVRSCRELTILATSREPLGVSGERIWWLGPMAAPTTEESDPAAVAEHEAVRLFLDRARETGADGKLTADHAASVAEICRRLDGLPLAIELAAARLALLTPAEIAARLDDPVRLLTRGRADVARHKSLLSTFEWSHQLLSSDEAVLFRRLSVFVGGCDITGAEEVCSGDGIDRSEVLDLIGALAAKSLVLVDHGGCGTRYGLLTTVRHYARVKLAAAGELDALEARHAAWYAERGEEARSGREGPRHDEWLDRLEEDHDNYRAALTWARDQGEYEVALRLANSLTWFWKTRGHVREGLGWLQWAVARAADAPGASRAEAMRGAGQLLHMLGDERSSVALVGRSVTLFREVGEAEEAGGCVCQDSMQMCRNPLHALPALEEKVVKVRAYGDPNRLAHALYNLGQARFFQADAPGARICFAEALALRPRIEGEAADNSLLGLARVALLVGDYDAVEPPLLEVLQHSAGTHDRDARGAALSLLAEAARARGDTDRARTLLDDAMELARQGGGPLAAGRCERILASVEYADGSLGAAEVLLTQALRRARTGVRLAYHEIRCLLGLADVAAASGDGTVAAHWYDEAEALARVSGDEQAVARALMGRAGLARRAGAAGRSLQLLHQALDLEERIGDRPAITQTLEAIAALAALRGQGQKAARLYGVASALREQHGFARPRPEEVGYGADLALTQESVGVDAFARAAREGSRVTVPEALAYARRGRGSRRQRTSGWPSLTNAERGVVALVAQGLTNPEVAERLFISRRTVQNHLAHVYVKLGISSRRELAHAAARAQATLSAADHPMGANP